MAEFFVPGQFKVKGKNLVIPNRVTTSVEFINSHLHLALTSHGDNKCQEIQ